MTSYNLHPTIPSAPEDPQVAYHLNVIQSKRQGLLKLDEPCKKKSKKYAKILDRLTWLNACSSRLSVATGTSSVVTLATFICLPVSIPLGAVSLAGAGVSGVATALTKKYKKKLSKVTKLTDIITSTMAVIERVVSKVLKNGKIDEEEFNSIQKLHLEMINKLMGVDLKMAIRTKPTGRDKQYKENPRNKSLMVWSLCYFVCYFKNGKDLLPT